MFSIVQRDVYETWKYSNKEVHWVVIQIAVIICGESNKLTKQLLKNWSPVKTPVLISVHVCGIFC